VHRVIALWGGGHLEDTADRLTPLLVQLALIQTAIEIGVVALATRLAHWRATDYLGLFFPAAWAIPLAVNMLGNCYQALGSAGWFAGAGPLNCRGGIPTSR